MPCADGCGATGLPAFEIVIVADQAGIAAVAAGNVIAFIDDDAVPEPSWLTHLTAPFGDPAVAASGGYVIGRNGISFQWKGRTVDRNAQTETLPMTGAEVFTGTPDRAIKTEGTNIAIRRDVLVALSGFDPAFAFYVDETDLNMRLAHAGHRTVIVPMAQVHHGFPP